MKTVTNIFELTEAVLELIADKICNSDSYSYTMYPDNDGSKNTTSIKIYNSNNDLILFIHDTFIEMKNVIAEEINKAYIEEYMDSLGKMPDIVGSIQYNIFMGRVNVINSIPTQIYTNFRYFNTEEQTFQQNTVLPDVLPYESTENIKTIKRKILQDIRTKWMV